MLPTNRPLTLEDFRQLKPGTILILHYNCVNQGTFVWLHHQVEGSRVIGQFAHPEESLAKPDSYLYEFQGYICRGSGAEPVWTVMPEGFGGADLPFDSLGCLARNLREENHV